MVIPNKLRFVYRIISACVAGIFLFQQVAWAGDLIDTTLERLNAQQSQTFAPSYLQNQQSVQETLVSQKQDIENFSVNQAAANNATTSAATDETLDLKGPMSTDTGAVLMAATVPGDGSSQGSGGGDPQGDSVLSITTQAGDVIHYKGGAIDYIEKKNEDGSFTVIKRVEGLEFVDSSNNLKNAEIIYADNTIEEVRDGVVETITTPDGTIYYYNTDGSIKHVLYKDKTITIYKYDKDAEGNDQTTLEDYLDGSYIEKDGSVTILPLEEGSEELYKPEKTVTYNKEGKLKLVVYSSGKTIQYDDSGMILYLKDEGSAEYFFGDRTESDGVTTISISKIINAGKTTYITFDSAGNTILSPDEVAGSLTATYNSTGSLIMVDDHGKVVTKEYLDIQNETVIAPIEDELSRVRNNSTEYWGNFFGKMSTVDYWNSVSWGHNPIPDGMTYQDVAAKLQTAQEDLGQARIDLDIALELERPAREAEAAMFTELKPSFDIFWKFPALLSDYQYSDGIAVSFDLEDTEQTLPFLKLQYQADGSISLILKPNGQSITYQNDDQNDGSDKILMQELSGGQTTASYTYTLSKENNVSEVVVDRFGIKRIYDQYGNIKGITGEGISVDVEQSSMTMDDGTVIERGLENDSGVKTINMKRSDGTEAEYADGVLTRITQEDGSEFIYDKFGKITSYNKKGLIYSYSDIEEDGIVYTIGRLSDPDIAGLTDPKEIISQKYDADKKLVQIERKDGSVLNYSYQFEEGKVIFIIANDTSTETTYDVDFRITKAVVLATEDDPVETISEYEYGRIRNVYKGDNLTYKYTYEYGSDEEEVTVIEDVSTGDFKRYKDELLLSITGKNNVVTAYEYNSDNKISKSTVTRSGKTINQYVYTYNADSTTTIEDIDGIKRTYDTDNKMVYLEENSRTYAYTYTEDADGKEYSTQEIIKIVDGNNNTTHYKNGKIDFIEMHDGSIVKDFVYIDDTAAGYTITSGGIQYFIEDGKVVKEVKPDKTIIEYYSNGWVKSVTDPDDKVTNYSYTTDSIIIDKDGLKYTYNKDGTLVLVNYPDDDNDYYYDTLNRLIKVTDPIGKVYEYTYTDGQASVQFSDEIKENFTNLANFSQENIVVDNVNDVVKIKLNQEDVLDYGNGSDGSLEVTANGVYINGELRAVGGTYIIDGTKQYSSIYIAPNAILTVSSWNGISGGEAVIKCNGEFKVDGVITVAGKGYRGGGGGGGGRAAGTQGESYNGLGSRDMSNNCGGGGSGHGSQENVAQGQQGAGGGYGTNAPNVPTYWGTVRGGQSYGEPELNILYKGSGGGGGGDDGAGHVGGSGGAGGGAIKILAKNILVNYGASVNADGANGTCGGQYHNVGGGGGSGGSVWLIGESIDIEGSVTAKGGLGQDNGGNGGDGRIRIDYVNLMGNVPTESTYSRQMQLPSEGTLTSEPIPLTATELGYLLANTETPDGTSIIIKTRTGKSSDLDDGTWSDTWDVATKTDSGYKINSSVNNYIQYQITLQRTDLSKTPYIYSNGDYAIKLGYSYSKTFDASAPSDDTLFKEYLAIMLPAFPISPITSDLQLDPVLTTQLNKYTEAYTISKKDIAAYMISKEDGDYFVEDGAVVRSIKKDGTGAITAYYEYYSNGWARSMTRDGKITNYEYDFDDTLPDQPIVSVTAEADGNTYKYDKDGKLTQIAYADNKVMKYTYSETDPTNIEEIELIDGLTQYYYDPANRLVKIADLSNEVNYIYEYSDDNTIGKILTGKMYNVTDDLAKFDMSNLSCSDRVELASFTDLPTKVDPNYYRIPDIGTGSDGAKHIKANETLSLGDYNFTSLIIDEGKTLTVVPGTTIKCLDTVDINGSILCLGSFDMNAYTVNIYSTGKVIGVPTIRCNTINNSGVITGNIALCGTGTTAEIHDGNPDSYSGYFNRGWKSESITYTVTFPSCNIVSAAAHAGINVYDYGSTHDGRYRLQLEVNGSWIDLYDSKDIGNGSPSTSLDSPYVTGWSNVTGIQTIGRINVDDCSSGGIYNYEMQAIIGTPTVEYINSTGDVSVSADTSDFTNALRYYLNGWIGKDGIREDILAQIPDSPSLLNDLYHGDRIYDTSGVLTSGPIAINATSLDYILASIETPDGTSVTFKTRTGASSDLNDGTWSDTWDVATKTDSKYKINSSVNKYIQYQAVLETTTDATSTPSIFSNGDYAIKLNYSYDNAFDANAPPEDVPFRDYLKLDPPTCPALPADLHFDVSQFENKIEDADIFSDTPIQTKTFKADLVSTITLADYTVIKYFNDKPISITMVDGITIDDIILEKYNVSLTDYKVENGLLIGYEDTTRDKVIVSFTAVNSVGDTYKFERNELVQIKLKDGTIITSPAQDEFSMQALALLESAFLPDNLAGERTYKNQDVSLSIAKDGKITYIIDNKIASVYQRYDDGKLEILMDYSYDESGNLIFIRLPYARDSIEEEIAQARQNIAAEKASYLSALADQESQAYKEIQIQVKSVRDQINAERDKLRPYLYQEVTRSKWVGWWIFGWYETYTETVEVPEVRNALNQLDEQERILNESAATAYRDLSSQIKEAEKKLSDDATTSLAEVADQEKIFQTKIIEEESTPVILEYFREILGRDPDEAETQAWLSKVDYSSKINIAELKQSLEAETELVDQKAFVKAVKDRLGLALTRYLTDKDALLGELKLSSGEVVNLDDAEIKAILKFLDEQNIHFGRSAFVALEELLKTSDIPYNLEDLAYDCILIDILTGTINGISEGKLLELSMYSLAKTAEIYGLALYNTEFDFDDLKLALSSGGPLIVHLKNNHFVIVTGIAEDGKVTYVEHNRGKDGYTWTVSADDFKESWTGYAITKAKPDDANKILKTEKAQRIKGSCLPFLLVLVGFFIQGVVTIAVGIVTAITTIVASISALLAPIISAIGAVISGIAQFMVGIGAQIFSAIKFVGLSLLKGITAFIGGTLLGGGITAAGSATGFTLTGLGLSIGKAVVLTALSFGMSMGLEAIGVNPTIARFLTSFVTGGVSGLFSNFSAMGFIVGGLQSLAVEGVNFLAPKLGIDPMLTNVLSVAAGAFVGAVGGSITSTGFDLAKFNETFGKVVLSNFVGEIANYGINKLGELVGIDPRISYLAGIGIRSSINAGLSDGWDAQSIWNGVKNGLIQGITNVSLDFISQTLNINPLLTELGFNTISSAISGLMSAWSSNAPPIETIFGSILNGWQSATLNLFKLGLQDPNNAWQQAAYIANIQNFTDIVMNGGGGFDGLVNAINTYASSMLRAGTIQGMMNIGTTVASYVSDQFNNMATKMSTRQEEDGKTYTYMRLPGSENYNPDLPAWAQDYMKFEQGTDGKYYVVGIKEGDTSRFGSFGIDAYGEFGMTNGTLIQRLNDEYEAYRRIEGGLQKSMDLIDYSTGEAIGYLYKNDDGTWDFIDLDSGLNFDFNIDKEELLRAYRSYKVHLTDETKQTLANLGIDADEFATLSYGLEYNEYTKYVEYTPLSVMFNDETKAILQEHPYLLKYYMQDLAIFGAAEAQDAMQREVWGKLQQQYKDSLKGDMEGYAFENYEQFRDRAIAELGGEISDVNLRLDFYKYQYSLKFKGVPEFFVGHEIETEYRTLNSEGKSTMKVGKIALEGADNFYFGNYDSTLQGFGGSGIDVVSKTTYGFDGSESTVATIEGGYKAEFAVNIPLLSSRYGVYSELSGSADDVLAKNDTSLTFDKGIHSYTDLANQKYEFYSFNSTENSNDGVNNITKGYAGFKYDFTTMNGDKISIEDKVRTDELRQKDPQVLTVEERAYLTLDALRNKEITGLTTIQQQEISDMFWNKVQTQISSNPNLNLTTTDLNNIHTAINEHVQGLNMISETYNINFSSISSFNPSSIYLLQFDTKNDKYDFGNIQPQGSN
ncbi:MAG: cysteine peptidase family C39 domain-containing protein [Candidatus Omnitrophota bacterium]|jgi:hypothetical protein